VHSCLCIAFSNRVPQEDPKKPSPPGERRRTDPSPAPRRLSAGRTTLIIAHRRSTALDGNQILVLEAGRVVEHGRHHQLLARGGQYAQMWGRQQAAPAA
jgi:hypothetical protein